MRTILIVDDEPQLRQLYRDALEDEGYGIVEAENGEAALRVLEAGSADLAILDIRMPGIHGLDLLKRLHSQRPHLPVILCSGAASLFDDYAVWDAGDQVVGKFAKPANLAALVRCIRQALEPALPTATI